MSGNSRAMYKHHYWPSWKIIIPYGSINNVDSALCFGWSVLIATIVSFNTVGTGRFPFISMWATLLAPLCTAITHQPVKPKCCSDPLNMRTMSSSWVFLNIRSFGFCFFVGDVIMGANFHILAEVTEPWAPMPRANFLTYVFNLQRVWTAFWLSLFSTFLLKGT